MSGLEAFPWSAALAAIVIVAGIIGGWYTLRSDSKEAGRRIASLEGDLGAVKRDMRDLELRIERECVKKGDLNEVKDQIIERVKEVEHTFRNEQAKSIGAMSEMFRQMLDRFMGARA